MSKVKIIILFCAIYIGGCAKSVYQCSDIRYAPDVYEIIMDEITALVNVNMTAEYIGGSSDFFLQLNFPGSAFDVSDLSYSSLPDITGDTDAIDQAYRLTRLTDNVLIICDTLIVNKQSSLEELLIKSGLLIKELDMITSAKYNDSFYPFYPNPAINDTTMLWGVYQKENTQASYIMDRQVVFNDYDIEMEYAHIRIERGNIKQLTSPDEYKIAVVSGVLLLRNLQITTYDTYVYITGKKIRTNKRTSATISHSYPQIIGYIYRKLPPIPSNY